MGLTILNVFLSLSVFFLLIKVYNINKKIKLLEEEALKTGFVMQSLSVSIKNFVTTSENNLKLIDIEKKDLDKLYKEFNEFKTAVSEFSFAVTEQISAICKSGSSSSFSGLNASKNVKIKPN